jgi:hypothetical protein
MKFNPVADLQLAAGTASGVSLAPSGVQSFGSKLELAMNCNMQRFIVTVGSSFHL